jgi:hypothetical protein
MLACKRGGVKDFVFLSVPRYPSSIEAYNRLDDRAIEVPIGTIATYPVRKVRPKSGEALNL